VNSCRPEDWAGRQSCRAGLTVVLAVDGVDDLRNGDVEFGQLVGFHPDSHRILSRAKQRRHLRNSGHTAQSITEVDIRVVREELGRARPFGELSDTNTRGAESDF
jgi:hypothetical protein